MRAFEIGFGGANQCADDPDSPSRKTVPQGCVVSFDMDFVDPKTMSFTERAVGWKHR
jgi:hypothetical protein